MKKFLVTLSMLSMTALLFTACNKGEEKPADEAAPAATETTVVEPVKTEEATEAKDEKAAEGEVKVDAAAETKTETK